MTQRQLTAHILRQYTAHLHNEDRSPGTIDKYIRDLRQFVLWLGNTPVRPDTAAHWRETLLAQGLAPVTINSKLAALNGLFHWLGWDDCCTRYLKVQRRMFRDASRELYRHEYERLVQTAHAQGKRRLALILETICASGIRVSELRYITVEAAHRGKAEIILKGKIRVILLTNRLCEKLLTYAGQKNIACGEIFLTTSGRTISRRQIWTEMKQLAQSAHIDPRKVFPHNLRHLFATEFYAASHDIVRLADILGHASVETTRIYLLTSSDEHLQQLEQLKLVS